MECAFEDDCITVNDVKLLSPPRTPEKIKQRMKCVVINKSPIRETKYSNGSGSMFSMNLCSEPSSTIRAVCFNEEMFDKSNKPDSVRARQLLYYLCNKRGMGATEIQNYMEKEGYVVASHSTILYGIDLIKKLLSEDTDFNLITLRLQEIEDFA